MKKKKAKKKDLKEKELAVLLLMMCIALEESKFELSLSEEDDDNAVEFSDPLTDIQGCISLNDDKTCNILIMDKTIESPSNESLKMFEKAYMQNNSDLKNHSELLIDGGVHDNTLLFYYDDIPIPDNTTMHTFRSIIMNAVMNVFRFRKVLAHFNECDE